MAEGARTTRGPNPRPSVLRQQQDASRAAAKEGCEMLQPSEYTYNGKSNAPASNPNTFTAVKTVSAPVEQATIGRSLVIKGELSGAEALYIDGRIEGKITLPDNRATIGRTPSVQATISPHELALMCEGTG